MLIKSKFDLLNLLKLSLNLILFLIQSTTSDKNLLIQQVISDDPRVAAVFLIKYILEVPA